MDIQLEVEYEEGSPQKKLKIESDNNPTTTESVNLKIPDTDLGDDSQGQTEDYIPFEKEAENRDEEGEMASAGSMIWRLRVNNLPKFMDAKTLKKSLEKWGIADSKPKKAPKWDYAFLTFKVSFCLYILSFFCYEYHIRLKTIYHTKVTLLLFCLSTSTLYFSRTRPLFKRPSSELMVR